MKPKYYRRSCPVCGQRMSWSRLYLNAWTWGRWRCESCHTPLKFNLVSRLLCALLVGMWVGFWGVFVLPHVAIWAGIVVWCIGSFAVLQVDRVSAVETRASALQEEDSDALP
jgi:hypothetical protein